jgi:predicted DNA-binding transcriptional regulator AlpA
MRHMALRVLTQGNVMPPIPPEQLGPCASCASDDRYLNARQVRARYADASDMWLWRRLNDDSGFPKPLEICGRRFWKLSALIAWERNRAVNAPEAA